MPDFSNMALPINILFDLFANPAKVVGMSTKKYEEAIEDVIQKARESAALFEPESMQAAERLVNGDSDASPEKIKLLMDRFGDGSEPTQENIAKAMRMYMYNEAGDMIARMKQLPEAVRASICLMILTLDHGDFMAMVKPDLRDEMLRTIETLKKTMTENLDEIREIMEGGEDLSEEKKREIMEKLSNAIKNHPSNEDRMRELINKARQMTQRN